MTQPLVTTAQADNFGALKPYDVVVFDWDGTVIDSIMTIVKSMQQAATKMGLTEPSSTKIRRTIGLGWEDILKLTVPTLPPEEYSLFRRYYTEAFNELIHQTFIFPGIDRLIENLHATIPWVTIATGKSRRGLEDDLLRTGLKPYFHYTQTASENPSKPAPAMLRKIEYDTASDPSRMIVIGDTTHDIQMAQLFGCRSVAVTYGSMNATQLQSAHPTFIVDDVATLAHLLGLS